MSFQFSYTPASTASTALTPEEQRMPFVVKMIADLSTGDVRIWRSQTLGKVGYIFSGAAFAPSMFETSFNLYANEQAFWVRLVGEENIPALLALRDAGLSADYSGPRNLSFSFNDSNSTEFGGPLFVPPSIRNPSQATLDNLSAFYDADAVADMTLPMTLVGDRYSPNLLPGTPFLTDILVGADGNDVLVAQLGNDTLRGAGGDDELYGGYGNDFLTGDVGNDFLYGEQQNDALTGGEGDDFLDGGLGNDSMTGGAGNDIYIVDSAKDIVEDKGKSTDFDQVLIVSYLAYILPTNIENCEIEGNDDVLVEGNELDNQIVGNRGDNELGGKGGEDELDGAAGDDTLFGGKGNDTLRGGGGENTLVGGAGNDFLDGSGGLTSVDYGGATADLQIDLDTGKAYGVGLDRLIGVSELLAGSGDDTVIGDENSNGLFGKKGDDLLVGGSGDDSLNGGAGEDSLRGGSGENTLVGGTGNDVYLVESRFTKVTEATDAGEDKVLSSINYTLPSGLEVLELAGDAVQGEGNVAANEITGNEGNNLLFGFAGNDALFGGDGNDTLTGCVITGGSKTEIDTLTGGAGSDRFVLGQTIGLYDDGTVSLPGSASYALIMDFVAGEDKLQLKGSASDYFLGSSPFSQIAGNALYRDTNGTGDYDASDELIAVMKSGDGENLLYDNTVGTALFVN